MRAIRTSCIGPTWRWSQTFYLQHVLMVGRLTPVGDTTVVSIALFRQNEGLALRIKNQMNKGLMEASATVPTGYAAV